MKRFAIVVLALTLAGCATALHQKGSPSNPLDLTQGIAILDPVDLQATHDILAPAVANGAGYKIRAFDNCAVAWLRHPEYLTSSAMPVSTSAPQVVTAGPISQAAVLAVQFDANVRGLQHKIALFSAPLPDDVMIACAPLEVTAGGIVNAFQSFLHPSAAH